MVLLKKDKTEPKDTHAIEKLEKARIMVPVPGAKEDAEVWIFNMETVTPEEAAGTEPRGPSV